MREMNSGDELQVVGKGGKLWMGCGRGSCGYLTLLAYFMAFEVCVCIVIKYYLMKIPCWMKERVYRLYRG